MIATEQETSGSLGLTPLVTGIIDDAQTLIRQQLTLFQSEIKTDLYRSKDAAIPFLAGLAISHLAGFFVFMMAAHLMVWLWPGIPLFAAYGLMGLVLAVAGGICLYQGKQKLDAFSQVAEKAVEGLKENLEWKTKV
jgi:Putative Actinobacterial Holin-X, holin superfamily III